MNSKNKYLRSNHGWPTSMLRYWLHVVLITLAFAGSNKIAWAGKSGQMLVRVFLSHPAQIQEIKGLGIELVSEVEGETRIDVLVDQRQLSELRRRDFSLQVLMTAEELMALEVRLDPEFHTYQEMLDELLALQSAHPQIARLESIGVSTQERRIIWAFKISDNVHQEEDEPAVLYDGVHHACEVMGLEICMGLINDLLNDYGFDLQVTWWVDNTEIWFVPNVNPDGHSAVTDSISLYWRKNGRDLNGNGLLYEYDCNNSHTCYTEGVNCNRNYDFNWVLGGSGTAWHYDYRGAFPFSEDENVSMRDLAVQQKFVISISYHSFGEIVYYPWYWDGWHTPDDVTLTDLAQQIASRITRHSGVGTYTYGRNGAKVGMSANWLYGAEGTFDFMIETLESPIFIPPGSEVDSIYRSNKPGALYILDRVHGTGITGTISDSLTELPLEARVKIFELYSPSVSPRTSDPVFGRYRWLLTPGTYNLEFSKPGYQSKIFSDVAVESGQPALLNAELAPYAHQTPVLSPWSLVLLGISVLSSGAVILILTRKAPGVWKS